MDEDYLSDPHTLKTQKQRGVCTHTYTHTHQINEGERNITLKTDCFQPGCRRRENSFVIESAPTCCSLITHPVCCLTHLCVCVCVREEIIHQKHQTRSDEPEARRWLFSSCCQSHFLSLFVHTQLSEQQFTNERAPQSALPGLVTHSHSLANTSFCFSLLFSLRRLEIQKWSLRWEFISGSFHRPARCCFRWRWRFKGQQAHQP